MIYDILSIPRYIIYHVMYMIYDNMKYHIKSDLYPGI